MTEFSLAFGTSWPGGLRLECDVLNSEAWYADEDEPGSAGAKPKKALNYPQARACAANAAPAGPPSEFGLTLGFPRPLLDLLLSATMDPNAFVAEVYRRMTVRSEARGVFKSSTPPTEKRVAEVAAEYRPILPIDKHARILDIGYGDGWFMAACTKLGYSNVIGADFGDPQQRPYLAKMGCEMLSIATSIPDLMKDHPNEFDFIHMSHVIEHIPKYSLLFTVDSLYQALRRTGTLFLRTPNMEGPAANSSYYVTLAHEYGFAGSNLMSLLDICGFDDIRFHARSKGSGMKQLTGRWIRWPFLKANLMRHRLFGVNHGGQFGSELIITGKRGEFPPFFSERYR